MVAKVLINTSVKGLNKVYDYLVKPEQLEQIEIGKRVKISFGRGDRLEEGIVVKLEETVTSNFKLKYIEEILDEVSFISEQRLKLAKWMSYLYFCNVYDCLKLMLPPGTNSIKNSKKLKVKEEVILSPIKPEYDFLDDVEKEKLKGAKQIRLMAFVYENEYAILSDVKQGLGITKKVVDSLIEKGYLLSQKEEIMSDLVSLNEIERSVPLIPTKQQQQAITGINDLVDSKKYGQALLFGVTGSGKTEVYLQVMEHVLKMGKTAIILVPEISLTYQTMSRFVARFGNIVSVLHSKMTMSERKEEYLKIAKGKSRIVVGARSALFAPISDIGIVIVDEEHDSSYYSQMNPKYSTKEVAEFICRENGSVLLLGSATPEITTYYKATQGQISLFEMKTRPNDATLPDMILVDKKLDSLENRDIISKKLQEEIEKNLNNKEQTMVFINRRGYSSYLVCQDCNTIFKCPHCDVAMTYHKTNNLLICHYCNYTMRQIKECNNCHGKKIRSCSLGIQKYEQEIIRLFPQASIIRMDRDTTIQRGSHASILEKFKQDKIDILIGTQMISKGHDIPNVTLIGVLGSDAMLGRNDYLSSERAYANISQVSGRAGRGEKKGRVIIETENPENSILLHALDHHYEAFYDQEIAFRKAFGYPPFTDLLLFQLVCEDITLLKKEAKMLYDILDSSKEESYRIYTPELPYIEKISNKYRIHILLKTKVNSEILKKIHTCMQRYEQIKHKNIRYTIFKNPISVI